MKFTKKYINGNRRGEILDKQLARILELKQQVLATGYHQTQLNDIIREVVDNANLGSITFEQSCELIGTLEYYCDFANKSKKVNCSG